jgi:hypothetical protein
LGKASRRVSPIRRWPEITQETERPTHAQAIRAARTRCCSRRRCRCARRRRKTIPLPVEVRCYTDRYSFEPGAYRRGDSPSDIPGIIAYYAGGNTIHIRAGSCADATEFTRGVYTAQTVGAFATLLHEALHRQGFRNENLTEAFAIAAMRAAGQMTQYVRYMSNGATDSDAAWRSATPTGDKVLRIAFEQANRMLATNYHTTWTEVTEAEQIGWAAFLKR